MALAEYRFYEELNDFLAPERRRRSFEYDCARAATVKNAIEALGIPHTEVELILVNGVSVDLAHPVREGDRIAVYPRFEAFDVAPLLRLREAPLRIPRFVADAHLGGLARLLRMTGFDTLYRNDIHDDEIAALAAGEGRIALTRDRELLKRRDIDHGCYVHALKPREQFREIVGRLQLEALAKPFTRCLQCNTALTAVERAAVLAVLPPRVAERYERFSTCADCGRVYWEGSHWERMREVLREGLGGEARREE